MMTKEQRLAEVAMFNVLELTDPDEVDEFFIVRGWEKVPIDSEDDVDND